jgi:hypothetical protein
LVRRHVARLAADDERELGLRMHAAVIAPNPDRLAVTDEARRGLQEKTPDDRAR